MSPSHLFCFGFGYSARALALRLTAAGWRVAGTCRSADTLADLAAAGVEGFVFDGNRPLDPAAFAEASHILLSVPPGPDGDPVLAAHGADLAALKRLAWVGYLSTTGVYGDHGGGWVDEDTPCSPAGSRGAARVAAETAWLDLWRRHGLPVHIFRLAGIYGPGRSAIDALRAGTARRIDRPGQVFSRIHVDDIAQVLVASIARPRPGAIYNVCDDAPSAGAEVVAHAAGLLGVTPPPLVAFDDANLSPMARSFYDDNKRVRNDRIKRELGVHLTYPSYREGLAAQLAAAPLTNKQAAAGGRPIFMSSDQESV